MVHRNRRTTSKIALPSRQMRQRSPMEAVAGARQGYAIAGAGCDRSEAAADRNVARADILVLNNNAEQNQSCPSIDLRMKSRGSNAWHQGDLIRRRCSVNSAPKARRPPMA